MKNYNDPEAKILTTGTLICHLNNHQFSLSEASPKKSYRENFKMTCLKKKNPRTNAMIPNVMIQCLKNDKKSMNYSPLRGGNLLLQYIQFIIQYEMR
jgi:hypothetical protein